ncbi:TolB family protein [Nonomuraea sp. NPDC052265]|uniref:TolB family protein n=1 Tax=Nonomuraea sp. NPDC052265 TaxID=3364374 RepID=UPI0037CC9DEB
MKIRVVAGVALGAALVAPATASAATAPELSGAAVYASTGHQLARYEGGEWSTLARIGALPQFAASPDGRKAAWVTDGGNLQVKDGAKTVTAARKLQGGTPCLTPVWSPDSTQIAYVGKSETIMAVKADGTGARRLGTSKGVCHLAWAAGGRYLAGYTGEADAVYRLDVRTGKSVRAKGVKLVTHVQSLSPNGRDAVVEFPANPDALGDGSWPSAFRPTVVDLVTGKKLTPAVKGRLIGAFYLADGRLVVRVAGGAHNTLVVLDAAGKETQRVEEPAKARTQALLQVLP